MSLSQSQRFRLPLRARLRLSRPCSHGASSARSSDRWNPACLPRPPAPVAPLSSADRPSWRHHEPPLRHRRRGAGQRLRGPARRRPGRPRIANMAERLHDKLLGIATLLSLRSRHAKQAGRPNLPLPRPSSAGIYGAGQRNIGSRCHTPQSCHEHLFLLSFLRDLPTRPKPNSLPSSRPFGTLLYPHRRQQPAALDLLRVPAVYTWIRVAFVTPTSKTRARRWPPQAQRDRGRSTRSGTGSTPDSTGDSRRRNSIDWSPTCARAG